MDQQQEKQDLPRHLDAAAVNPAPVNPANPVLRSIALSDAVTPGIHQHTYLDSADNSRSGSPSYFSQSDRKVAFASSDPSIAATPSITTHNLPQSPGSITGKDILKRMTLAAMGRRESLSRIREANPDLQLSGNIISATFNIPHSVKYRKGSDWVCPSPPPDAAASAPIAHISNFPQSSNPPLLARCRLAAFFSRKYCVDGHRCDAPSFATRNRPRKNTALTS